MIIDLFLHRNGNPMELGSFFPGPLEITWRPIMFLRFHVHNYVLFLILWGESWRVNFYWFFIGLFCYVLKWWSFSLFLHVLLVELYQSFLHFLHV